MLQSSYDEVNMDDKYACGDLEVIFGKEQVFKEGTSEIDKRWYITKQKEVPSVEYYPPSRYPLEQPKETIQKEWSNVASIPPALASYYSVGGIEVIDYIKAKLTQEQYKGYLLGNIYKYSGRLQHKGEEAKDIAKLVEYTTWLKEHNKERSSS